MDSVLFLVNIFCDTINGMIILFQHRIKLLVLLLMCVVLIIGYFYRNNVSYTNPDLLVESDIRNLIEAVGELMVLPSNEVPTIATVSDPSALKNQIFFSEAKRGDKVLIYTGAKKAILYDPVINKIINITPVNMGEQSKAGETGPSSITLPSPTVNQF